MQRFRICGILILETYESGGIFFFLKFSVTVGVSLENGPLPKSQSHGLESGNFEILRMICITSLQLQAEKEFILLQKRLKSDQLTWI
jgi:hypothetical protein